MLVASSNYISTFALSESPKSKAIRLAVASSYDINSCSPPSKKSNRTPLRDVSFVMGTNSGVVLAECEGCARGVHLSTICCKSLKLNPTQARTHIHAALKRCCQMLKEGKQIARKHRFYGTFGLSETIYG